MNLTESVTVLQNKLNAARHFYSEYPEINEVVTIQSDFGYDWVSYGTLEIACDDENRDTKLAAVGEYLGRDGWTVEEGTYAWLNWIREFEDGLIRVRIYKAELLERPLVGVPVPPNKFPLLLQNAD